MRAGTYPQASTLAFSNADSGQNGHYVKYMAYQSEQPIITGGQPVTGWTLSDSTKGIYSASGVTTPFRQLYVNGVKAIRARSPNLGASGALAFNRLTGSDNTAQNIQIAASEVSNWNNFTKVEMHVMTGWGDNTLRLASMTTSGSTAYLKIQSPESTIVFPRPFPHLGGQFGGFTKHCYYFENALELLDQAGEWYLDETKGVLSYKPRSGEDMTTATVVAPMVETVVSVNGTSTSSQAGYLWFQGITFAHSTYMRPSQSGFCDAQAGQYNLTATTDNKQTIGRPPAGVSVMNANHIHFEQVDIEHNEIGYTNYTGISVGYGWTSTVNAMSNNYINYNNIHHVTQIMADGAALYVLSNQQPASQMEYNYIHDYQTSQWADYGDQGIYLDEQTSGYTVAHNAMVNAPTNVAQNNTGTNTITDNPAANSSSVTSMAGIEASYADIKNTTIPVPSF